MQNFKTPIRSLVALILLIASLFCSTLVTAQTAVQPQGAGTVASPYLISNWQELYWISQTSTSWDKQFLQTADIDLALAVPSIKTWSSNTGWTPIGKSSTNFSGRYDGGGFAINGLYINRPSSYYQSLFGYTSATAEIHNLGATGAEVSGSAYAGVLVGDHSGNISNCFTIGSVKATNYAGGFAGYVNPGGRISNSLSRASVSRSSGTFENFGGFAGYNYSGSITNCYSTGRVMYLTGSSPTNKGFVGGVSTGGSFSMTGNYWDTQASGQITGIYATGRTTAQMQTQTTFTGWDFTNTWAIDPQVNARYPHLRSNNSSFLYLAEARVDNTIVSSDIRVFGALVHLGKSTSVESGFLINTSPKLDLSASGHIAKIDLGMFTNPAEISGQFTGLSSNTTYYICAYSTNEHGTFYSLAISGKTTEQASTTPAGAGTAASPYLISNWQELYWISQTSTSWDKQFMQTTDIDLAEAVPSIATWNTNTGWTPIGNSTINFSGKYDGGGHVINGLYINRPSSSDQALFGRTSATAVIKDLGLTGAYVTGNWSVGVFIGRHSGTLSNCFSSGRVEGLGNVGGFAGYIGSGGQISNSFSRSDVFRSRGANSADLGGFAGYNSQGKITNCYSTGRVMYLTGSSPMDKGFVGGVYTGSSFSMTGNYWNTQSSEQTTGTNATGKTTALMQTPTTFTGWDFTNTWAIDPQINAGYPYLKTINTSKLHLSEAYIYQTLSTMDAIKLSGALIALGNSTTAESGFLINTSPQPDLSASGHIYKLDLGMFTSPAEISGQFTGLSANTIYYICAYSTNEHGTFYSLAMQIKTTEQPSAIPQGDGTVASPYLISNWQELSWISQTTASWDKHILQTADIDLSLAEPSITTWNTNTGWTPLGNWSKIFTGSYDGGGHVINGLYINRPSSSDQALFGYTSATAVIKDLGIAGADVTGDGFVGVLVGRHFGTISNCFTTGRVEGLGNVGGFAGYIGSGGQINNSFSRADVFRSSGANTNFGGFAGYNDQGKITNCYSTARVIYLTGSSPMDKGFVGGVYTGGSFSMAGNYWDTQKSGQTTGTNATGKTTALMQKQTTFTGWDFTNTWAIDLQINAGYPYLILEGSVPALSKPEIVAGIVSKTATSISAKVILAFSGASALQAAGILIDSKPYPILGISRQLDADIQALLAGDKEMEIDNLTKNTVYYIRAFATSSSDTSYSAQVVGQTMPSIPVAPTGTGAESDPYIISSLQHLYWIAVQVNHNGNGFEGKHFNQINDIDATETKLWNKGKGWEPIGCTSILSGKQSVICNYSEFGGIYNGSGFEISNLHVYTAEVAGLFGSIGTSGLVKNLSITNANISGNFCVGTLSAVNHGSIIKCVVSGITSITAEYVQGGVWAVGGLVGENNGVVNKCIAECIVTEMKSSSTGGFIGHNSGSISSSVSRSTVINGYQSAGFVCVNVTGGIINNCYASGGNFGFGFINENSGQVSNSYSLGTASTGFGGSNSIACFWDIQTSKTTTDYSGAVGKTSAEMKMANTFIDAGWDFLGESTNGTEDIWAIHPLYNNGYPFLTWEAPRLQAISGKVYYDRDREGTLSNGDIMLRNTKVELLPLGTITGTARDGSYLFFAEPGDYTVKVLPETPFSKGQQDLEIDAAVKLLEDTELPAVGLYGTDVYKFSLNLATTWTRCATTVPLWAVIQNNSYFEADLVLEADIDPLVKYVSADIAADSIGSNGKRYFTIAAMQPFESRTLRINVGVPPASTDSIFYSAAIFRNGQVVAADKAGSLIRCSYDPNDVQVFPGGLTENGYVPMGQELTYLVRFQNTGNDTAFMVDILDTLAPSLDPLSFEMLASSHEMRYFIERNGALRFLFEDINLEDSTSNEPASHGFVLFKVKPRTTVTTGTRVGLTAHIYFDSNSAVVTNTAVNTFTDQYTKVAQSIDLTEGWNLVSFYVQPGDNAIENALSSCIADIEAVKTGDAFYSADQPEWLNSLNTINGGQAYLIKAKRDTKLTVNGLLVFKPFEHKLNKGWNMVGCPVKTDVAVDPMLKNKPVTSVKDFDGFWLPTTSAGNMINFEPGKGYFIFSDQPAVLPW